MPTPHGTPGNSRSTSLQPTASFMQHARAAAQKRIDIERAHNRRPGALHFGGRATSATPSRPTSSRAHSVQSGAASSRVGTPLTPLTPTAANQAGRGAVAAKNERGRTPRTPAYTPKTTASSRARARAVAEKLHLEHTQNPSTPMQRSTASRDTHRRGLPPRSPPPRHGTTSASDASPSKAVGAPQRGSAITPTSSRGTTPSRPTRGSHAMTSFELAERMALAVTPRYTRKKEHPVSPGAVGASSASATQVNGRPPPSPAPPAAAAAGIDAADGSLVVDTQNTSVASPQRPVPSQERPSTVLGMTPARDSEEQGRPCTTPTPRRQTTTTKPSSHHQGSSRRRTPSATSSHATSHVLLVPEMPVPHEQRPYSSFTGGVDSPAPSPSREQSPRPTDPQAAASDSPPGGEHQTLFCSANPDASASVSFSPAAAAAVAGSEQVDARRGVPLAESDEEDEGNDPLRCSHVLLPAERQALAELAEEEVKRMSAQGGRYSARGFPLPPPSATTVITPPRRTTGQRGADTPVSSASGSRNRDAFGIRSILDDAGWRAEALAMLEEELVLDMRPYRITHVIEPLSHRSTPAAPSLSQVPPSVKATSPAPKVGPDTLSGPSPDRPLPSSNGSSEPRRGDVPTDSRGSSVAAPQATSVEVPTADESTKCGIQQLSPTPAMAGVAGAKRPFIAVSADQSPAATQQTKSTSVPPLKQSRLPQPSAEHSREGSVGVFGSSGQFHSCLSGPLRTPQVDLQAPEPGQRVGGPGGGSRAASAASVGSRFAVAVREPSYAVSPAVVSRSASIHRGDVGPEVPSLQGHTPEVADRSISHDLRVDPRRAPVETVVAPPFQILACTSAPALSLARSEPQRQLSVRPPTPAASPAPPPQEAAAPSAGPGESIGDRIRARHRDAPPVDYTLWEKFIDADPRAAKRRSGPTRRSGTANQSRVRRSATTQTSTPARALSTELVSAPVGKRGRKEQQSEAAPIPPRVGKRH